MMQRRTLLQMVLAGLSSLFVRRHPAREVVVTRWADDGPGTLRRALEDAKPGDVIRIASGVYGTFELSRPIVISTHHITFDAENRVTWDGRGERTQVTCQQSLIRDCIVRDCEGGIRFGG